MFLDKAGLVFHVPALFFLIPLPFQWLALVFPRRRTA